MQDENVDGSGKGSRDALMQNLRTHGCDLSRVELVAENSLRLTPERIISLCGGQPRLFSIDGGHTAEATRNDLTLADRTACEGALVILDDYFNSSWPGVSEGTCIFMREDRQRLVPVAITSNKFIFTVGKEQAAAYRQRSLENRLSSHRFSTDSQVTKVFGADVIVFEARPRLRDIAPQTELWLRIRDTPFGVALRGLKRWI
ncbi:MAG TPA: class I SAM-dependent methyltransferase [Caldimonas sp.]|nr:class I SAM-dependent methyltransferase [Caldimonas sp.]